MPADAICRFVSGANITRFVDQLRSETRPARQEMLRRLLIEEENRFGATEESLAIVERHISDGAASITRQTEIIAKRRREGVECAVAESALRTSQMIQALFENLRDRVCEARERSQL
jgi:hypothetical protein